MDSDVSDNKCTSVVNPEAMNPVLARILCSKPSPWIFSFLCSVISVPLWLKRIEIKIHQPAVYAALCAASVCASRVEATT
jgi:hypothetical protein